MRFRSLQRGDLKPSEQTTYRAARRFARPLLNEMAAVVPDAPSSLVLWVE